MSKTGLSSVVPTFLEVRFQFKKCDGSPSASFAKYYSKFFDTNEFFEEELTGVPLTTKIIYSKVLAIWNGDNSNPKNKDVLDDLAEQISKDYCNWLKVYFDESYNQVIAPKLDALTDHIEFIYRPEHILSRRYTSPYVGDLERNFSHDPEDPGCVGSESDTEIEFMTPCFESYGPPEIESSSSSVTLNVYKNCFIGGELIQTFVRTDTVLCNSCSESICQIFATILYKCPSTGLISEPPETLVVKLYKDGVFVVNGIKQTSTIEGSVYRFETTTPPLLTPGSTGWKIIVPDTKNQFGANHNIGYYEYESDEFSLVNDPGVCQIEGKENNKYPILLYRYSGWDEIHVIVSSPCTGGIVSGVATDSNAEVTATQNGVTINLTYDSVNFRWFGGEFMSVDPVTKIPYSIDLHYELTNTDRINNFDYTIDWSNQSDRCTVFFPTDLDGVGQSIPNHFVNADIKPEYRCGSGYGCSNSDAVVPVKKDIIFNDSVYGAVSGTWNSTTLKYVGTKTVTSPGCSFVARCGFSGTPTLIDCPAQAVDLTYEWNGSSGGTVDVTYKYSAITCISNPAAPFACPDAGGSFTVTQSFTFNAAAANRDCGIGFYMEFIRSANAFFCLDQDPNPGTYGHSLDMYPSGGTVSIVEA